MNKPVDAQLFAETDGEPVTFAIGDVIITEGETGDCFYLLDSGSVEVTRGGQLVSMLEAGAIFGELALADGGPRNASVIALTECAARRFDNSYFWERAQTDLGFCHFIMNVVSNRVRRSDARLSLLQKSLYRLHGLSEEAPEIPAAKAASDAGRDATDGAMGKAPPEGAHGRSTEKMWKGILEI